MKLLIIAARNLMRQKKRSVLLAIAIIFGFTIVTLIDAFAAGTVRNIANQVASLLGAHVSVEGHSRNADDKLITVIHDDEMLKRALDESGIAYIYANKSASISGTLVFEGKKTSVNISGFNPGEESYLKSTLVFSEGNWEAAAAREDALILSTEVAGSMGITVGDSLIVQTTTVSGQANFGEFYVAAIHKDASLFATMLSYANSSYINQILELQPGEFISYNILLADPLVQDTAAQLVEQAIRAYAPVTSRQAALLTNPGNIAAGVRDQVDAFKDGGTIYSALSLNDEMPQLNQVVTVTQTISLVILIVLFLIIIIGISNTFKMILKERMAEIGTMRALGMSRWNVAKIFILEALLLSLFGAVAGLALSAIIMQVSSLFTFTDPVLSMFFDNGHITWIVTAVAVVQKFLIIIVFTMLGVFGTVRTVVRMKPVDALRSNG
ncbi:ABC transporter permease [Spirochaetia bacterium]|nr:ABC transporter permease [Spirochaetia bacterium]